MRIRWRGLELPGRVVRDDAVSTDVYGRFTIEPFERGFGTTIGNSLRRVLLSSLEGAAVISVKISGVSHEFANIDGVLEDVTDIILNVKGIVVGFRGVDTKTLHVERNTAGEIRVRDIVTDPAVALLNPDHLIATLTDDVEFKAELTVQAGRGYVTANAQRGPEQEVSLIPLNAAFSPVLRVRFRTEDMRVGQRVNYDRLILEVWTNSTISPEDALVDAGVILRKHLNPFVLYHELGDESVAMVQPITMEPPSFPDNTREELLDKPVTALNLSVRACNCLEIARITTLRELVSQTENDLLRYRSFGKTSLEEVQRRLADLGLSLGMQLDGEGAGSEGQLPEGAGSEGQLPVDPLGEGFAGSVSVQGPVAETLPAGGGMIPPIVQPAPLADDVPLPGAAADPSASADSGPMATYTMDD